MPVNERENGSVGDKVRVRARLFIAGDSPNSRIARENVKLLQKKLEAYVLEVDIVDVAVSPEKAIQHAVFVTPALQIVEPEPGALVYGNLSNWETLRSVFPGSV
jgi:hypothetical protein